MVLPLETVFNECAGTLRAHPPQRALEEACKLLRARIPAYDWVGVYVIKGRELHLAAWAGAKATQHTAIPLNTGLCGWAASTGELVNVPDVSKDRRYLSCFSETKSELVVPILVNGQPAGEIDIDSSTKAAFTRDDELFCNRLAVEMVPALRTLMKTGFTTVPPPKP